MFPLIYPDDLTITYATLTDLHRSGLAPGVFRAAHNGGRVYQLVKNAHSAALAIGDWLSLDLLTNDTDSEVKRPATADLDRGGGVAMGAIEAAGYGWICRFGYVAKVRVKGDVVAITAGDSLKGVDAVFTMVKDTAAGTEPTFARHVIALDAATAADTTVEGFVRGL